MGPNADAAAAVPLLPLLLPLVTSHVPGENHRGQPQGSIQAARSGQRQR